MSMVPAEPDITSADERCLTVRPLGSGDHPNSLVMLAWETIDQMGLSAGSTVRIEADRSCFARIFPCCDGALSKDEVFLPELVRANCAAEYGEAVSIRAVILPALRSLELSLTDGRPIGTELAKNATLDQTVRPGDQIAIALPGKNVRYATVSRCFPETGGSITSDTIFEAPNHVGSRIYPKVGGLESQIARIREMIELPMKQPEFFERLGITPPRGVLFTGPPGSGKTLLARAVAEETSAQFFHINAPEIVSKHYGDSEQKLRDVFVKAERQAPSIIFIDEIDAIAPKRDGVSGEKQLEKRVVAQLLTLMDGLAARGQVVLMAATNLPQMLDPALRRPGRFDREIPFEAPSRSARRDILAVHTEKMPLAPDVDLDAVARGTDGFVGADLAAVVREAAMSSLRRVRPLEVTVAPESVHVTQADFDAALGSVAPSALRETHVETPETGWGDVGGLEEIRQVLADAILLPMHQAELANALGLEPVSGLLLQGPPGSGKTLLARALANESGLNFIPVRGSRLLSQYLGEAERQISELFARARHAAPCLLFFDEIDAIAPNRSGGDETVSRIVAQLLTEIDGIEGRGGVILLGATNRIEAVDPALLRPGRFDLTVELLPPGEDARVEVLRVHTRGKPIADDVDLGALSRQTEGWSGADLAALCQGAARHALKRQIKTAVTPADVNISVEDFRTAFAERQSSDELRSRTTQ